MKRMFVSFEPNMVDFGDHYYNYNFELYGALRHKYEINHAVVSNSSYSTEYESCINVIPAFNFMTWVDRDWVSPHSIVRNVIFNSKKLIEFISIVWMIQRRFKNYDQVFFLVTAVKPYQLIALFFLKKIISRNIKFNIVFNTTELVDWSCGDSIINKFLSKLAIMSLNQCMFGKYSDKINFFTDSHRILDLFNFNFPLLATKLRLVNIPAISRVDKRKHYPGMGSDRQIKVGYLGIARTEKGFCELANYIEYAIRGMKYPHIHFTIQVRPSPHEIVVNFWCDRLKLLEKKFPKFLRIIDSDLNASNFVREMNSLDALLLPYSGERYAYCTSGLLSDAFSCGVVPLVTSDTWMSDIVHQNDYGILIKNLNYDGFDSAFQALIRKFDEYRRRRDGFSDRWRRENSPTKLVDLYTFNG